MAQRAPVQKRSRERFEQILLAAADQLAKSGSADDLTTTSVSKRSGIPVATIYRYFADRMAIIATLIDRETAAIDETINEQLGILEVISIEQLFKTIMLMHLEYFRSSRRSIVLWFGARNSSRVLARVERRYAYMGTWLQGSAISAGLVVPEAPDFGGELIVWQGDRMFEFMFRQERSVQEQDAIFNEFVEMATAQILKYATPAGVKGVPGDEFRSKSGVWNPTSVEDSPEN